MNPYDIDTDKLTDSEEVKDERQLIKIKLIAAFLDITDEMTSDEIISATGLDKADLSRLRAMNTGRFSIDKIIVLLDCLGFRAQVDVLKKEI